MSARKLLLRPGDCGNQRTPHKLSERVEISAKSPQTSEIYGQQGAWVDRHVTVLISFSTDTPLDKCGPLKSRSLDP
jgi:hypothetical protein